jgi:hypothetical protein
MGEPGGEKLRRAELHLRLHWGGGRDQARLERDNYCDE